MAGDRSHHRAGVLHRPAERATLRDHWPGSVDSTTKRPRCSKHRHLDPESRYARPTVRVRTRHSFAAPFVLVVGCSSGGGTRTEPGPVKPALAGAAGASVDAPQTIALARDAAVDAPNLEPAIPGTGLPTKLDPCDGSLDPGGPTCNPPPPQATEARIVSERIVDGALVVVVDRGVRDGVSVRWSAVLLARDGKVIPGGAAVISDVGRDSCRIRFPAATRIPPPQTRVRMTPP